MRFKFSHSICMGCVIQILKSNYEGTGHDSEWLTRKVGTYTLSRNVGKQLQHDAA
jgi:hypothetical protein